jgi:hypothetical protein
MRRYALFLSLLVLTGLSPSAALAQGEDMLIRAAVQRVLAPHIFTIEYQAGLDGELVVVAPEADATPVPGTSVLAAGRLRQVDEGRLKGILGSNQVDDRTRQLLVERPILVATSVRTAAGQQLLTRPSQNQAATPRIVQPSAATPRPTTRTRMHPGALAELIDDLGGADVALQKAKVLVVLSPQAFLVESASPLPGIVGNLDRLLVLVGGGALRVDPAQIVGSNVTVIGAARTLLGLQVSAEVPWPAVLTRENLKRFEIRAGVLATSVQTADGVELTTQVNLNR